jgi:hypothetical protein
MDTTKLKVGQKAHMRATVYGHDVKVIEVSESGVIVETLPSPGYPGGEIYHFDVNGVGREEEAYWYCPGDFLIWELTEEPFFSK